MDRRILWVLDFGHRGPEPGLCNEDIASAITQAIRRGSRFDAILTQNGNGVGTKGVGQALVKHGIQPDFTVGISVDGPHAYLGTREVVERFQEALPLKSGDNIIIACHQAAWLLTRLSLFAIGIGNVSRLPLKGRWDKESNQFQARGPFHCFLYVLKALAGYGLSLLPGP